MNWSSYKATFSLFQKWHLNTGLTELQSNLTVKCVDKLSILGGKNLVGKVNFLFHFPLGKWHIILHALNRRKWSLINNEKTTVPHNLHFLSDWTKFDTFLYLNILLKNVEICWLEQNFHHCIIVYVISGNLSAIFWCEF